MSHQWTRKHWPDFVLALVGVSVIAGAMAAGPARKAAQIQPAAHSNPALTNPPQTALDEEDRSAYALFEALTHASVTEAGRGPEWNHWMTKRDVQLPDDGSGMKAGNGQNAELVSMEFPTQVISRFSQLSAAGRSPASEHNQEQGAFLRDFAGAPQLASVLFSPKTAASILHNHLFDSQHLNAAIDGLDSAHLYGADRHLREGSLLERSMAVKLVWEILPNYDDKMWLRFYDDANRQYAYGVTDRLRDVSQWQTIYAVDTDHPGPCQGDLPSNSFDPNPKHISLRCLYYHRIAKGDMAALRELSGDSGEIIGNQGEILLEDVYVVLVGVHVMRLTPERPQWEWMTFYWTNVDNGQGWRSPWRFFGMKSTDRLRNQAYTGHKQAFNPYLEGTNLQGMNANCLNCHSLAAYSSQSAADDMVSNATLIAGKDWGPDELRSKEERYFTSAVQTGFLWSLSAASSNSIESTRRQQFRKLLRPYLKQRASQPAGSPPSAP